MFQFTIAFASMTYFFSNMAKITEMKLMKLLFTYLSCWITSHNLQGVPLGVYDKGINVSDWTCGRSEVGGGTPIAGGFLKGTSHENSDDWGYPYSRKPPFDLKTSEILRYLRDF